MLNKIIAAFLISLVTAAQADTVTVNPDHPDEYIVQKGDTLWDISGRFLAEPWLWPEVWKGNPQIANPHLIYPGDVVRLTYLDGQPILSISNVSRTTNGRTVKLSPSVRTYERDDAIPAIPIDSIKSFLTRPLVVDENEMEEWPYIVASYDQHLIAGNGNKVYVRGLDDSAVSKRYAVYRRGEPYTRTGPDGEEEVLGYEAMYVGDTVIKKAGDPATGIIAAANREILIGDRLREEVEDDINSDFIPKAPIRDVQGSIISVVDGVTQIGQYQVVVLDVGEEDGLETGNILGIYQSGVEVPDEIASAIKARKEDKERLVLEHEDTSAFARMLSNLVNDIRDNKRAFDRTDLAGYLGRPNSEVEMIKLPEDQAGVLMIIRTFDKMSYGLVMDVTSPVHVKDVVRNM